MTSGKVTFAWSKFPKNLAFAMLALSLTSAFDIWSKLDWYGQFLMIVAITLLVFQPKVVVKSDKIRIAKEDNEDR